MSRASRLEPIAEFSGKIEDEAARRLAASAKALQTKEREVEQLRGYLAEYRQRAELERGAGSLRWRNAREFLQRLSDAVAVKEVEFQQAVERHRLEVERWRESHRRTKSLDTIIERIRHEELLDVQKRDQRELDELALQRVLGRR